MSTLELLKMNGATAVSAATSKALETPAMDEEDIVTLNSDGATEPSVGAEEEAYVEMTAEIAGATEENPFKAADIKKMKLSDVNLAYETEAFGVIENWGVLSLVDKKKALLALVSDPVSAEADAGLPTSTPKVAAPKPKVAKSEDLIEATAQEIENIKDASSAHKMIHELSSQQGFLEFRLGGCLAMVQSKQWFGDHANFKAFIEAETDLDYRKAMYLISIYVGIIEANIPWEKVSGVGWTKLKDLVSILTQDNVDEWVTKAKNSNYHTLVAEIAAYKKSLNGDATQAPAPVDSVVSTLTFKVHDDQKDVINAALEKAMKAGSTDVKTVALEYMAHDYLASSGNKAMATQAPKAAPITAEAAAQAVEAKAYFVALANLVGPDNRLQLAQEILEAFDSVFPDVELTVTMPNE